MRTCSGRKIENAEKHAAVAGESRGLHRSEEITCRLDASCSLSQQWRRRTHDRQGNDTQSSRINVHR